jgi:hypothetical protein
MKKADNFDLRKFLAENKLTTQSNLNEGNLDVISRSLNILDKAADMAIKNPEGDVVQFAKIVKKYIDDMRKSLLNN